MPPKGWKKTGSINADVKIINNEVSETLKKITASKSVSESKSTVEKIICKSCKKIAGVKEGFVYSVLDKRLASLASTKCPHCGKDLV